MPRKSRQESRSGYYHVMIRGINKEKIFQNEQDKGKFMKIVRNKNGDGGVLIIAYCLMDNHFHLVAKGEIRALSNLMKKINIAYASYYNKNRERVGHVFQDRFRSEAVETDEYLYGLVRYVHNNPVKAGIVMSPEDWLWSSCKEYLKESFIISDKEAADIKAMFGGKRNFLKNHRKDDEYVFLDMEKDMDENRMLIAKGILNREIESKRLVNIQALKKDKNAFRETLAAIAVKTGMSRADMSKLLSTSESTVNRELRYVKKTMAYAKGDNNQ